MSFGMAGKRASLGLDPTRACVNTAAVSMPRYPQDIYLVGDTMHDGFALPSLQESIMLQIEYIYIIYVTYRTSECH